MAALIDYSKFQDYRKPKKNRAGRIFLFLFLISMVFVVISKNFLTEKTHSGPSVKPAVQGIINTGISYFNPHENSKELESIVQTQLSNSQGDYAVAIKNLKTGERYYFNEHKIFETASLYKLFVMGTVFRKIQDGNLSQNDILSQKIAILNQKFRISSESAELTEGDISLPIESALTRMITISDNYSALLLAEKVRLSQVAIFLTQNGLIESHVGTKGETPETSAFDVSLFFEKLYKEELASKQYTQAMLTLLKNQKLNGKLPKYLPQNINVSHKTGELGRLSHDAGIVYTPKGEYVIVVLTETPRPLEANENIAVISKSVYDYFTR